MGFRSVCCLYHLVMPDVKCFYVSTYLSYLVFIGHGVAIETASMHFSKHIPMIWVRTSAYNTILTDTIRSDALRVYFFSSH